MAVLVVLISISLIIAIGFLISFLWNMKTGQYDDTYSPSVRMLFEDRPIKKTIRNKKDGSSTISGSTFKKV